MEIQEVYSSSMSYTEYKSQFGDDEEMFLWFYGELEEIHVKYLLDNENASDDEKNAMLATWKQAREENAKNKKSLYFLDPAARKFMKNSEVWHDYESFNEYIWDLEYWLINSSWRYTREQAKDIISREMRLIVAAYENHEPIDSIGIDIGYGCG